MAVVAEEDVVNHGRTTPRNGQVSRYRHRCTSQMTEACSAANCPFGETTHNIAHLRLWSHHIVASLAVPQRRLGVTGISYVARPPGHRTLLHHYSLATAGRQLKAKKPKCDVISEVILSGIFRQKHNASTVYGIVDDVLAHKHAA